MQLYLVRHPQPVLDKRTCYGRSDIAVAPEVLQSCLDTLVAQLPPGLPIVSSPLQRCAQLAHALAVRLGQPEVRLDDGLQEMDFGSWEMRPWDDIPWSEVEAWNQDLLHYAPGGGETLPAVAARMWRSFCALLMPQGRPEPQASASIVVCHAGSIRMLQACAQWWREQGGAAAPLVPDTAALEQIAMQAVAQRREIPFAQPILLPLPPAPSTRG